MTEEEQQLRQLRQLQREWTKATRAVAKVLEKARLLYPHSYPCVMGTCVYILEDIRIEDPTNTTILAEGEDWWGMSTTC